MSAAFVTGGSSGIGLEAARQLASAGHDVALFARDPDKLLAARNSILNDAPSRRIEIFPVDVSERDTMLAAIDRALDIFGAPQMAIASAGIAEPGLFTEQSLALHEEHMAVNYFGSLYFTRAVSDAMITAGGGKIGLISSGAAFFGIYGYGAYAPSKFALRGLAEVLHLELGHKGIGITLCYPPDTDTPQLAAENRTKPVATQKITKGGGLWSAQDVAAALIEGMNKDKFVVTPGFQIGALHRLTSLIAPALRWHQKRIIRKEEP
ncbi:SDR family oxidoreductase [Shimia litoralis]|uniref:3-dehydrosphinganine reductase n=1 Tax=Shimia litoralis TaxID=420403 RepID=A0A4U7MW35_9RHOB|nr:SDR family oxidoreductase [Shimia litoralis]TKZ17370.1 SDR family oxidoreductase [Shimia litoralis]